MSPLPTPPLGQIGRSASGFHSSKHDPGQPVYLFIEETGDGGYFLYYAQRLDFSDVERGYLTPDETQEHDSWDFRDIEWLPVGPTPPGIAEHYPRPGRRGPTQS